MSAEGRARIIAAQKARWAKVRAQANTGAQKPATAKKRNMSPAGRERLRMAVKARWVKYRAAKGKANSPKVSGQTGRRGQGRVFTPEHRAKLAAAQKARFAKLRKVK